MTEETAKKKWCPFVRILTIADTGAGQAIGSFNRYDNAGGTKCIASDCMCWREHIKPSEGGYCGLVGSNNIMGATIKTTN